MISIVKSKSKIILCNNKLCVEIVFTSKKDYVVFEEHRDYYSYSNFEPLTWLNFLYYNINKLPKEALQKISDKLEYPKLMEMYGSTANKSNKVQSRKKAQKRS